MSRSHKFSAGRSGISWILGGLLAISAAGCNTPLETKEKLADTTTTVQNGAGKVKSGKGQGRVRPKRLPGIKPNSPPSATNL